VPHETDKHGTERTTTVNDTASMSWHLFLKLLRIPRICLTRMCS